MISISRRTAAFGAAATLLAAAGAVGTAEAVQSATTTTATTATTGRAVQSATATNGQAVQVATVTTAGKAVTPPTCRTADLYVAAGPVTGGAGSLFHTVGFTNTSTHTCVLRGFPGVSVVNAAHHQIGAAATRNGATVTTVTLAPDHTVTFTIRTNNQSVVPTCRPTAAYIRVYPPASTQPVLIPDHLKVCGSFETNPVGTAG